MPRGYNRTRGDLSSGRIRKELEESLKALRTDYIDLYWLHRDEEGRDAEEILETLNGLAEEGKIRYFDVSNWKASRILEADACAEAQGLQPISASQIQFGFGICSPKRWGDESVVCMNEEEYALYRKLQLPLYAYSAQSEGYFARVLSGEKDRLSPGTLDKYDSRVNQKRAERLQELAELCRREGRPCPSPAFVFLEYCLRAPFPVVFIHGGSNKDRLLAVRKRAEKDTERISPKDWAFLLQDGDFGDGTV